MKYNQGDKVIIDDNSKYVYEVVNIFKSPRDGQVLATIYCKKIGTSESWPVKSSRMKLYKEGL